MHFPIERLYAPRHDKSRICPVRLIIGLLIHASEGLNIHVLCNVVDFRNVICLYI